MFLANELALKKHCVHVPKYSIDASMDFLPTLSNLVVTNSQLVNLQTFNYVWLHSSNSLDLLSFTLARVTPSLHFVSIDDYMWVHDAFKLSMGSPNGVDPCVEPYFVLFESF